MSSTAVHTETPAGAWRLDTVHSSASFAVRHMVVSTFRGRFEDVDASLVVDGSGARLTGAVAVDSIEVRDENLAAHLRSADFFDAGQHPTITFESNEIRRDGDRLAIDGELTVKGITRRLVAQGAIADPIADPYGGTRLGITLEATVDRREFGLDWNAELPKGGYALGNDVTLTVELEFILET